MLQRNMRVGLRHIGEALRDPEAFALRWQEEGTLYGNDRNEAIHYQGARCTTPEDLFQSEGAYLTWLYCLMCQPHPKNEQFVALGNERWMPAGPGLRRL